MALAVQVHDELTARTIAQELIWLTTVRIAEVGARWEVALDSSEHLDHVLAAVRSALKGRAEDEATVLLNGHAYVLQGET